MASSARRRRSASESAAGAEPGVACAPAGATWSAAINISSSPAVRLDAPAESRALLSLEPVVETVIACRWEKKMRRWSCLLVSLMLPALHAGRAVAQGSVSGQVSLIERAGERSEDLADAIIWLEPGGSYGKRGAPATATIQLKGRQFSPRVRAVAQGSRIEFPNLDSFSHNVFSKAPNGAFDTGVFPRGRTRDQTFRDPGVFPVYCNIHPRMTGYIVVLASPWFAQAGDDGRYTIAGVPAGTYTLHLWHDRAPESTRQLVVTAAGAQAGRVELDARGYRYVQHQNKFGQQYPTSSGDRY